MDEVISAFLAKPSPRTFAPLEAAAGEGLLDVLWRVTPIDGSNPLAPIFLIQTLWQQDHLIEAWSLAKQFSARCPDIWAYSRARALLAAARGDTVDLDEAIRALNGHPDAAASVRVLQSIRELKHGRPGQAAAAAANLAMDLPREPLAGAVMQDAALQAEDPGLLMAALSTPADHVMGKAAASRAMKLLRRRLIAVLRAFAASGRNAE